MNNPLFTVSAALFLVAAVRAMGIGFRFFAGVCLCLAIGCAWLRTAPAARFFHTQENQPTTNQIQYTK